MLLRTDDIKDVYGILLAVFCEFLIKYSIISFLGFIYNHNNIFIEFNKIVE